jgi:formamidopyrimidine-DNA glycosylase
VPELPEVETLRRVLEPLLLGRRLERVEIDDARLTAPRASRLVAQGLAGERIAALERRGKYLLARFASGRSLLIHLRMSGSLRHAAGGPLPDDRHRRAVVWLEDGSVLSYRDVRRFGTWLVLERDELEPYLERRLGPEPLEPSFDTRALGARLAGRRTSVKAALLDQRTVAGIGNIYADEALWRARLHPRRQAGGLAGAELAALRRGIRAALRQGISRQGSTLRDYALPDGRSGGMQHEFKVYGRTGEPCERCGAGIERITLAGRGTWYCPSCQAPLDPGLQRGQRAR